LTIDNNSALVGQAIEHICFLADVNQLFDEALGLYRLDMTLLIAQKSQKAASHMWQFLMIGSSRIPTLSAEFE